MFLPSFLQMLLGHAMRKLCGMGQRSIEMSHSIMLTRNFPHPISLENVISISTTVVEDLLCRRMSIVVWRGINLKIKLSWFSGRTSTQIISK